MKVIKEESKVIGLLRIDDDVFTYDTPIGMTFDEFNRLSGMDYGLFTYEVVVHVLSFTLRINHVVDGLVNDNLDIYEPRVCFDENGGIYTEGVIFVNKRLVRLMDVTIEQWLDLIYGDHTKVDKEINEEVISKWLIRSYKKQFNEYVEIKKK
nr:hypothetical protein [Tanacetum cinerariifolium]